MEQKVICPKCKETVTVLEYKKYITCPYCEEEFAIKRKEEQIYKDNKNSIDVWNKLFKK